MIIDTHAHIYAEEFSEDLDAMLRTRIVTGKQIGRAHV